MQYLNKKILWLFLTIMIVTGCATQKGLNRNDLVSDGETKVTNEKIEEILALKPQLKFPFKLGVFVIDDRWGYFRENVLSKAVHANEDKIQKLFSELKSKKIISDVVVIPSSLVKKKTSIENIRIESARLGIDAVLIINALYDVDRYNNFSSFLYLSIIGLWVIPGTNVDALSIIQGALFDVRNGYLYFTLESEGRAESIGPAMIIENKNSALSSLNKATLGFIEQLEIKINNLK